MSGRKRNPDWETIEEAASKKRTGRNFVKAKNENSSKIRTILDKQELIVQRLSSELSGKTPKYAAIGAREFVPYVSDVDDVTLEAIKKSCYSHFKYIDESIQGLDCDILATERGPSCYNLEQIPNLSLIHIRFIKKPRSDFPPIQSHSYIHQQSHRYSHQQSKSSETKAPLASSFVAPKHFSVYKAKACVPKSLSLSTMLKMGKTVEKSYDTVDIKIEKFEIHSNSLMVWENISTTKIRFFMSKELLGEGAFRDVYKATSTFKLFSNKEMVIKRYKLSAIEMIKDEYKQTVEQHTRKSVQMQCLAKYLASKLALCNDEAPKFKYLSSYFGIMDEEFVTIEEKLEGGFRKYVNNDGNFLSSSEDVVLAAECLAHFSHEKSEGKIMLLDIQGVCYNLTDPEIATADLFSENDTETLFCIGNVSRKAIKVFCLAHECNKFCIASKLTPFDKGFFQDYNDDMSGDLEKLKSL